MKQIHKMIPMPNNSYINRYFSEDCGFFDIETTGFSPKYAFVYLIGMAARIGDTIHIYQFLAETRQEEKDILAAFYRKSAAIPTLITFNGIRFDIPFLKSRETLYSICGNWDNRQVTDLYKLTAKLAHLFQLPDKKQKSVEKFLGIDREDRFTGGELIQIYYQYEKTKDPHAEILLLLHNYEDVLGMTKLLSLFAYRDFLELPPNALYEKKIPFKEIPFGDTSLPLGRDKETSEIFLLALEVPMAFPKPFSCHGLCAELVCHDTSAKLYITVFNGTLKFYYDNYKDYYYLPEEDMAIHKSVAAFVEASHKKKASASTCYTKKSGLFLPQPEHLFSPCFYPDKKAGISYFELNADFISNQDALNLYVASLLQHLCP